ncbi:unnamed protein product [Mytilus coruscus]|uniref:Uncharacterized protein n=1 Tax=Mytilus coruscus TaxID=42192 RepID=A0A6J8AD30_MYTCO|nr:unnamed protein product [Mytilus coruscus]
MDICNFAKVILTRATKDISSLHWWKKQNSDINRPLFTDNYLNNNSDDNSDDNSNSIQKSYTSNFSLMERHQNYMLFMDGYPKMHVEYDYFKKRISRLQSYLTEKKYWKSGGKSEERNSFLDYFGLQHWYNLQKLEKQNHTLEKCNPCRSIHIDMSSLHKSLDKDSRQILETCQTATDHFINTVSPTSMTQQKGVKIAKSFINIVQPIIEEKVNIKFNCKLADSLSPSAITAAEHQQEIKKAVTVSKKKFEEVMKDDGNDVTNFLSSGKSFNQYHRDRMAGFYESKVRAEERTEKLIRQESAGKKKSKQHHGNFENYSFDRTDFLNEMTTKPSGSDINWTLMAKKYNLQINGKFPANAGQVILEYARKQGINTQTHNKGKRVSSRDYLRRIRRAKNTIYMRNKQHSLPTPRTGKAIKEDVKRKLQSGELYIGVKIAEKTKITTVISPEGELISKTIQLFARKMPLTYIREQSLKDQLHQGLFKYTSDEEYDKMDLQLVKDKLFKLGLTSHESADQTRSLLKSTERTRKLKIWHDHSDILNHSYICFTVSFLYDEANFYTDQEFKLKHPDKKPINVQALEERPKLYIFGQSGSSDEEQTLYTRTRLEDLQEIHLPTRVTHDDHNLTVFDDLRVFSGDGPALQFESAVEHGNYVRCFNIKPLSLDERCQLATSTTSLRKLKQGIFSPFQNLKKADLVKELKARNIETTDKDRKQLQEDLTQLLHGISRPPALMIPEPHLPTETINILSYEILCTEPLHDLTNVIQNIIAELPYHIQDKEAQKDFQNFSQTTIGDKNQVKGSDARLYLVKLAKFAANLHEQKKIDKNTIQMIESLVEITNICYSKYECRSPKQILRLYNQCFLFAVTCRIVIGIPSNPKMSKRKFFGSHFHSVTVHLPECLRIFNLRSIVTEQEERIFGDLRRISENTTNRQTQFICDNAMLRFNSQQAAKTDYFTIQESVIQKQAHFLAPRPNSTILAHIVSKQPTLLQAHLERISDFFTSW